MLHLLVQPYFKPIEVTGKKGIRNVDPVVEEICQDGTHAGVDMQFDSTINRCGQ